MSAFAPLSTSKYLDINNYGSLPRIVYRINEGEWQIPEWDDENSRYVFHVTKGDTIQFKPDFSLPAHPTSENVRYVSSIYINPYDWNSNGFYECTYDYTYTLTEKDIILILSTFNNESYNSYIDYIYEQENYNDNIFELDENNQIIWVSSIISNEEIWHPILKENILNKYKLIAGTTFYRWYYSGYGIFSFTRYPQEGDMCLIYYSGGNSFYYNYISSVNYLTNIYLNKKLFNFTTDSNCRFSASGNPLSLFYEYEYDFKKLAQINSKALFMRLFAECEGIVSCKNISLSAQLISDLCYYEMFLGCRNLKDSIKLKNIRKLGWACYAEMYANCPALEEAGGLMAQKITSSCYANMFYGCSSLKEVPLICAETLKEESLKGTFAACTSLKSIPNNFFNKTVPYRGYYGTFESCTGIESLPDLSFDEIGQESLYRTFSGCTSLESIENILVKQTQSRDCMCMMFLGCTSLESIGNIEIKKNNSDNILDEIFSGCTSLVNTGYIKFNELSFACLAGAFSECTSLINYINIIYGGELKEFCFESLYQGCTNLETAPELSSKAIRFGCYQYMFSGCSKINYIKINVEGYTDTSMTHEWLKDVSYNGDLISNSTCNWEIDSPSGVPEGWNLYYNDSIFLSKSTILSSNRNNTFTIKVNSLEDWRISSTIPTWVHFSKTSEIAGSTQVTITIDTNSNDNLYRDCDIVFSSQNFSKTLHISQNVKNDYAQKYLTFNILSDGDLIIKRVISRSGSYGYSTAYIYIRYKINDGDWSDKTRVDYYNGTYSIPVVSGDKVNIKIVNYDSYIYKYYYYSSSNWYEHYISFENSNCTFSLSGNLFSFIELENDIYGKYFLSDYSKYVSLYPLYLNKFKKLFMNCDGLINIDNLYIEKDITLQSSDFANLFSNCYNLTSIPFKFLPHTTLNSNCYDQMFYGCESLTTIPEDLLPAQTLANNCYYRMFENCYGLMNIPENLLPAMTLADSCYYRMFYNCELIEKAPILPAENLVYACYYQMFYNCYSLSFINCQATSIGDSSTYNWVRNVSEIGVFEKAPNMENWTIGDNGIPTNWVLGGIVIYTTSYTINTLGGTITLNGINTHNVTWNLVNNNSWISNNISSGGKGDISITLSIDPNTTSSFKEAYLYITSTDLDEDIEIYIYQEAPEIIINKTTYNVKLVGGTINITGYSTYLSPWNLTNNVSWISYNISSTSSGEINFNLTISSSEEERTGVVYISCPGMTNDIPITINQINSTYTINLGNGTYPWQIDTSQTGPNGETIYKSGNQGYASTYSIMTIIIKDYPEFKLKVKSDGETSCDYLYISNLDTTSTNKWSGSNNHGTWQDVTYSDISSGEHTITITFKKDYSVNIGTDSGYFYIQE